MIESTDSLALVTHILCCSCGMYFSAAPSSENDHGTAADPLYQHLLLTAEKKFWRCVESGDPPRLLATKRWHCDTVNI